MKLNWVRVVELTVVVVTLLSFSTLIIKYEYPAFEYGEHSTELVEVWTTVGQEVSRFLWNYRLIDLMAQAFVLFLSAACCVAMLRTEEGET